MEAEPAHGEPEDGHQQSRRAHHKGAVTAGERCCRRDGSTRTASGCSTFNGIGSKSEPLNSAEYRRLSAKSVPAQRPSVQVPAPDTARRRRVSAGGTHGRCLSVARTATESHHAGATWWLHKYAVSMASSQWCAESPFPTRRFHYEAFQFTPFGVKSTRSDILYEYRSPRRETHSIHMIGNRMKWMNRMEWMSRRLLPGPETPMPPNRGRFSGIASAAEPTYQRKLAGTL